MLSPHLPYGQVFFVPSVRMKLKNGFALALQPLYRLATYLLNNFIEKISAKIEFHLFFFQKSSLLFQFILFFETDECLFGVASNLNPSCCYSEPTHLI